MYSEEISQEWLSTVEELADIYIVNDLKDEYQTVKYLFCKKQLINDLKSWLRFLKQKCYKSKSEELGEKFKINGNTFFKSKSYLQAIKFYNKCIENSPRNTVTFAYGLSNRAYAYMEIQKFDNAQKDLELLFILGTYPKNKMHKLYSKQAKCLIALGKLDAAKCAYENAIDCLKHQIEYSNADLGSMLKNLNDIEKLPMQQITKQLIPIGKIENENSFLPGASDKVSIRYSEHKGRHVIANRDILKDELIFMEAPFSFTTIFNNESSSQMCNECGYFSDHIFVCENCCSVYYCSEECRIKGWQSFHHLECEGSKMSLWSLIGIAHLTFRVVLVAYKNLFNLDKIEKKKEYNCIDILTDMNNEEIIKSSYSRVFQLITNHNKLSKRDSIKYAITSVMLSMYLTEYSNFFEDFQKTISFKMSTEESQLFIACILYRHMLQMICNASLITSKSIDSDEQEIGVGIYPSSSIMNHSCVPNTSNRYNKNIFIVTASRDIKSGSEVFNCYGPQFSYGNGKERRLLLKCQYNFDCECEACLSEM